MKCFDLNTFIDIQTSKTLIQMDINEIMRMKCFVFKKLLFIMSPCRLKPAPLVYEIAAVLQI